MVLIEELPQNGLPPLRAALTRSVFTEQYYCESPEGIGDSCAGFTRSTGSMRYQVLSIAIPACRLSDDRRGASHLGETEAGVGMRVRESSRRRWQKGSAASVIAVCITVSVSCLINFRAESSLYPESFVAPTEITLEGLRYAKRVFKKTTSGRARDARQELHNARRPKAPQR